MLKYLMLLCPFHCVITSIRRSLALNIEMRKLNKTTIRISIIYPKKNSVIRHEHEQNSVRSQLILLITNVFESLII